MHFLKQSLALLLFFSSFTLFSNPTIRPYSKDTDETALIAIFKENPQYLLGEEWGKTEKEKLSMAKKYLASEKYKTLVLEVNDVSVAFVNYCICPPSFFSGKIAFLHLLGVSNKHRRNGYGLLLMEKAIESIKKEGKEKLDYIMLAVKSSNKSAIALYEKIGFKPMYGSPSLATSLLGDSAPIMYKLVL